MGLQIFRTKPDLPYPVACRPLLPPHAGQDLGGLCEERSWRRLAEDDESRAIETDILVSRWVDSRTCCRSEQAISSPGRHIIGVALKTTRLKLTRGPLTIFDGIMPLAQPDVDGPGSKDVPVTTIVSPVFIGRDVRVAPSAKIGPYTVLGDGCVVGAGATVSDSLLWDGVVVEPGATVDWAIVASRAHIGAGAIVARGSVIGHDATVAAHSSVEENARIPAVT